MTQNEYIAELLNDAAESLSEYEPLTEGILDKFKRNKLKKIDNKEVDNKNKENDNSKDTEVYKICNNFLTSFNREYKNNMTDEIKSIIRECLIEKEDAPINLETYKFFIPDEYSNSDPLIIISYDVYEWERSKEIRSGVSKYYKYCKSCIDKVNNNSNNDFKLTIWEDEEIFIYIRKQKTQNECIAELLIEAAELLSED